jgi:hypothetical protein
MNYTISRSKNAIEKSIGEESLHCAESFTNTFAVGTLTNYKEVVDMGDENYSFYDDLKVKHYGLSKVDLNESVK